MSEKILLVELHLANSNDDIIELMRVMKYASADFGGRCVICAIRDFDHDPRELCDIPEVRAFCRRIVNLGFLSYLYPSLKLDDDFPEIGFTAWGAAELWMCSEGLNYESELTEEMLDQINRAINAANDKAEVVLGSTK